MDRKTRIRSTYAEFFQSYATETTLPFPDPRPSSTYRPTSSTMR
jgi:hypothetical protein